MTDARIARIERGIAACFPEGQDLGLRDAILADLRAWQEIADRHSPDSGVYGCYCCGRGVPCPDAQAADAALDRLDALWAVSE